MTVIDRRYSVAEGQAVKTPCAVATTANITLAGEQTVNGVAVAETSPPTRVLVKDQGTASENGIYDVSTGNWTRARDFDGSYDVVTGTRVYVNNSAFEYVVTTADPIVIGTSSIVFIEHSLPTRNNFTVAATAPTSPLSGDEWLDTTTGILYTSVDDGVSQQWAEF